MLLIESTWASCAIASSPLAPTSPALSAAGHLPTSMKQRPHVALAASTFVLAMFVHAPFARFPLRSVSSDLEFYHHQRYERPHLASSSLQIQTPRKLPACCCPSRRIHRPRLALPRRLATLA
ncbi:hypothetical protein HYPSUDRAFT_908554 [Hypholoma sublateritium FD-334 SS-4]|uniref:Uncharacterized protein n=1 Tax=Hypholoma sublateritium (strain FD-334 SS-4) TaxID=945553 RepID=A0A0D2NQB4_HYPSF|nr:hypothetical protein HYPSUDRAFT_908554 [Hypholoma sublateritium FD-334 SS-4]